MDQKYILGNPFKINFYWNLFSSAEISIACQIVIAGMPARHFSGHTCEWQFTAYFSADNF